jgi:hypothetical protein
VELSIGLILEKPIVEGFAKCKDQFWPFSVGIKGKKQNKIVRCFKKWNAWFYRPFIFWNILQVVNEQICLVRSPPSDYGKTRGVSHCGLAIYIKKYLKAKEELWKLKYFTMQKYNLQKILYKKRKILQDIITL